MYVSRSVSAHCLLSTSHNVNIMRLVTWSLVITVSPQYGEEWHKVGSQYIFIKRQEGEKGH